MEIIDNISHLLGDDRAVIVAVALGLGLLFVLLLPQNAVAATRTRFLPAALAAYSC